MIVDNCEAAAELNMFFHFYGRSRSLRVTEIFRRTVHYILLPQLAASLLFFRLMPCAFVLADSLTQSFKDVVLFLGLVPCSTEITLSACCALRHGNH